MWKIIWLQAFIVATTCTCVSMTCADTTIYDKNYNLQGYKKESDGTTTVYDKNWNHTGYEKGDKIYDKNWNVKGYKKRNDSSGERGFHGKSKER